LVPQLAIGKVPVTGPAPAALHPAHAMRTRPTHSQVRGKRLPVDMVEVTTKFKKVYEKKDLEQLWGALLACYGSEALARQVRLLHRLRARAISGAQGSQVCCAFVFNDLLSLTTG